MPYSRQASFLGGEISPDAYARTDLDMYFRSVRLARNFFATPRGSLMNRSGTEYIAATKDSGTAISRLVPFVFSDDQAYVLEFGVSYVRFYKNGAPILSGGVPYTLVSTYTAAQLFSLKFSQSGDSLFIACSGVATKKLVRTSDTSWAFTSLPFAPSPATIVLTMATDPGGTLQWHWNVVGYSATGEEIEFGTITDTSTGAAPARITWTANPLVVSYEVFRARGTSLRFGFVGSTSVGEFYDDFHEPDYSDVYHAHASAFASNDYAAVVGFFEQRMILANVPSNPAAIYASETGNFRNFVQSVPQMPPRLQADSELLVELSTRQFEEIRALVPLRSLLVLTSGAHWTLNGAQGGPLRADEIPEARVQYVGGVSWLDPLIVGSAYLAVQERGNVVRELAYSQEVQGYAGHDVTIYARHFFDEEDAEIVDWCYAREPYSIVWVVRDDGVLLSMTYQKEEGTYAWAQHDIAGGEVESICSIPEGDYDAVYMVVKRVIEGVTVRYVERFANRRITDVRDGIFLDSAVSSDGRNTDESATRILNGETGWGAGDTMDITSSPAAFVAGDVGKEVIFGVDNPSPVRVRIVTYLSADRVRAEAITPITILYRDTATDDWGLASSDYDGLDHLEGEEVSGLADGAPVGPFTVVGGAIELVDPATVVQIGLYYPADVELLDLASRSAEFKVARKNVTKAFIEVAASRGLFVGESLPEDDDSTEGLEEWDQRDVSDEVNLVGDNAVVEISIKQSWNAHGRVVLRQKDPLPVTVLAVTREFEMGDA